MSASRGGIFVPLSNPDGVAPLLDLAFAATLAGEPQPSALVMVPRKLGEAPPIPPPTPTFDAAMEFLRARNSALAPQLVWTDDPAGDIVRAAAEQGAAWILMGSHRPVLTPDYRGGTTGEVLAKAADASINVAVLIYGPAEPRERLVAVVDYSPEGEAAMEISVRTALGRQCQMRTLMVPRDRSGPDLELLEMVKQAGGKLGRRPKTDVLTERNAARLAHQTPGSIVVISSRLTEHLGLPLDSARGDSRRVLVVHSAR
jgi:hypothetical protein